MVRDHRARTSSRAATGIAVRVATWIRPDRRLHRPDAIRKKSRGTKCPEAGVQDLWIDGERLYVAAQNGGVRVVDISADLKGNLYHQGREIARFVASDANAPMPNVVAVQPIRGAVLAADRCERTVDGEAGG